MHKIFVGLLALFLVGGVVLPPMKLSETTPAPVLLARSNAQAKAVTVTQQGGEVRVWWSDGKQAFSEVYYGGTTNTATLCGTALVLHSLTNGEVRQQFITTPGGWEFTCQ